MDTVYAHPRRTPINPRLTRHNDRFLRAHNIPPCTVVCTNSGQGPYLLFCPERNSSFPRCRCTKRLPVDPPIVDVAQSCADVLRAVEAEEGAKVPGVQAVRRQLRIRKPTGKDLEMPRKEDKALLDCLYEMPSGPLCYSLRRILPWTPTQTERIAGLKRFAHLYVPDEQSDEDESDDEDMVFSEEDEEAQEQAALEKERQNEELLNLIEEADEAEYEPGDTDEDEDDMLSSDDDVSVRLGEASSSGGSSNGDLMDEDEEEQDVYERRNYTSAAKRNFHRSLFKKARYECEASQQPAYIPKWLASTTIANLPTAPYGDATAHGDREGTPGYTSSVPTSPRSRSMSHSYSYPDTAATSAAIMDDCVDGMDVDDDDKEDAPVPADQVGEQDAVDPRANKLLLLSRVADMMASCTED